MREFRLVLLTAVLHFLYCRPHLIFDMLQTFGDTPAQLVFIIGFFVFVIVFCFVFFFFFFLFFFFFYLFFFGGGRGGGGAFGIKAKLLFKQHPVLNQIRAIIYRSKAFILSSDTDYFQPLNLSHLTREHCRVVANRSDESQYHNGELLWTSMRYSFDKEPFPSI